MEITFVVPIFYCSTYTRVFVHKKENKTNLSFFSVVALHVVKKNQNSIQMNQIFAQTYNSVERGAVSPDLAEFSGLDADPPELDHRVLERREEAALVPRKVVDGGLRLVVGVEHLVGPEKPEAVDQVLVVVAVERDRRDRVHVHRHRGIDVRRAHLLELLRVQRVERWVDRGRRAEVVQAVGEPGAVREADRVGAGECDYVEHSEVVFAEERREIREVVVGPREVPGYQASVGDETVEPAEFDREVRPSSLAKK